MKDLNNAVNLLAFLLILFGGCIALHNPDVGEKIIIGALGVFGGGSIQKALTPNQ